MMQSLNMVLDIGSVGHRMSPHNTYSEHISTYIQLAMEGWQYLLQLGMYNEAPLSIQQTYFSICFISDTRMSVFASAMNALWSSDRQQTYTKDLLLILHSNSSYHLYAKVMTSNDCLIDPDCRPKSRTSNEHTS